MAWKKYSELSADEKAKRAEKKKITNSIMSPKSKALELARKTKYRTPSKDWS